jgi:hypothetical protein
MNITIQFNPDGTASLLLDLTRFRVLEIALRLNDWWRAV